MLIISLNLPTSSLLTAALNDLSGAIIAQVYRQFAEQGNNAIQIDLSKYSSGTYFLKLNAIGYEKTFKVIITK